MTLDLDELERKAKAHAKYPYTPHMHQQSLDDACERTPFVVLALIERVRAAEQQAEQSLKLAESQSEAYGKAMEQVRALERVAKAVRSITKDVAEHDRGADCPYVSQEQARELLAIIDGVNGA